MPNRRRLSVLMAILVAVVAAACGGDDARQSWRDLAFTLPDGWTVYERGTSHVSAANAPLGGDDVQTDGDVVSVQFAHDPTSANPGPWRSLLDAEDADVEADRALLIDGVPATSLTYRWTTNGVSTRERVVVVPSREIYILLQPVPRAGDTDAPDVFLRHAGTFGEILDSIDFGAPVAAP